MDAVPARDTNDTSVSGEPTQRRASITTKKGRNSRTEPQPATTVIEFIAIETLSGTINRNVHRCKWRITQYPFTDPSWLNHFGSPERATQAVQLQPLVYDQPCIGHNRVIVWDPPLQARPHWSRCHFGMHGRRRSMSQMAYHLRLTCPYQTGHHNPVKLMLRPTA